MKISKEQKQQNREALLMAAVSLSREKPFSNVSMKSIAKQAGMSEATIYNYFPTREDIVIGYLEWSLGKAMDMAESNPHFANFPFTEKVHSVIEYQFELMNNDKAFVQEILSQLFVKPIPLAQSGVGEVRSNYLEFLDHQLNSAIEKKELAEPPFRSFVLEMVWNFHIGMIFYWSKDQSEGDMNTTQLADLSLALFKELLAGGVFSKAYNLMHFLFREHVMTKVFKGSFSV